MLRRSLGWLSVCVLMLSATLAAQQNATLQGIVADDQKAVMPGVTVTAIDTRTGRQSVEVTATDGRYQFENLPPGDYKLRVELSGFATAEITSGPRLSIAIVPRMISATKNRSLASLTISSGYNGGCCGSRRITSFKSSAVPSSFRAEIGKISLNGNAFE